MLGSCLRAWPPFQVLSLGLVLSCCAWTRYVDRFPFKRLCCEKTPSLKERRYVMSKRVALLDILTLGCSQADARLSYSGLVCRAGGEDDGGYWV